jgi:hypothetical protein
MELTSNENIIALFLCAVTWLTSYFYYEFMVPIPVQPKNRVFYSFPFVLAISLALGEKFFDFDLYSVIEILLGLSLIRFLVSPFLVPAKNQPGPFLAKFTRLWKLWQVNKGSWHLLNRKLHRTYGSYLVDTRKPLVLVS